MSVNSVLNVFNINALSVCIWFSSVAKNSSLHFLFFLGHVCISAFGQLSRAEVQSFLWPRHPPQSTLPRIPADAGAIYGFFASLSAHDSPDHPGGGDDRCFVRARECHPMDGAGDYPGGVRGFAALAAGVRLACGGSI